MLSENSNAQVLFDGRFIHKPPFGISRDSLASLTALTHAGALGGVLNFKNSPGNSSLYPKNLEIQLSKSHKQLAIRSLLNQNILIPNILKTNIFYQNQVDAVKYKFSHHHQRVIRIHDMFPVTNPEWFTKKSVYSFKKGISNIESQSIIFANSKATSESFQNIVNTKEKKYTIFVVPCSTVKNKFSACSNCGFCQNANLISVGESYLLSVGTIEPRKNYNNLLNAWRNSKDKRLYQKLVIVGKIGWKSMGVIRKIGQSEDVIHISDCCDVGLLKLYENAEAFIAASLNEGFDIPLDEASQQGLRLLISDIAVHRERFDTENGSWFQPDSIESITNALQVDPQLISVQTKEPSNFEENFLNSLRKALDVDQS
jgi:glycosyltransferase involved in cell wall biosynthesis